MSIFKLNVDYGTLIAGVFARIMGSHVVQSTLYPILTRLELLMSIFLDFLHEFVSSGEGWLARRAIEVCNARAHALGQLFGWLLFFWILDASFFECSFLLLRWSARPS